MATVLDLTREAFEHGALCRPGRPKTVTIDGRRLPRIRVQVAIFSRHYGAEVDKRDAWLVPQIDAAVAEIRS